MSRTELQIIRKIIAKIADGKREGPRNYQGREKEAAGTKNFKKDECICIPPFDGVGHNRNRTNEKNQGKS